MIVKHADKRSGDLAELTELLALDLTPQQRAAVDKEIHNVRRGVAGESGAAHYLDEFFHGSPDIAVLHDLRLVRDGRVMQVDHLLFTRDRQVYVIETKNYGGRLSCNDRGEWTAWYGAGRGKGYPIPSPVEQVLRQAKNLARWFEARGIDTIAEIHVMVMVLPTCSLPKNRDEGQVTVIKADNIRREWERRSSGSGLQAIWRKATKFSESDLVKFATSIAQKHEPSERDWHARFGIEVSAHAGTAIAAVAEPAADDPAKPIGPAGEPASPLGEPEAMPAAAAPPPLAASATGVDAHQAVGSPVEPVANGAAPEPIVVETPLGVVTIKRIPKGSYAVRHAGGDALAARVREAVKDRGRWQGLFKNWLVQESDLSDVIERLREPIDASASSAAQPVGEATLAPSPALSASAMGTPVEPSVPSAASAPNAIPDTAPSEVATPFGVVTVKRIPDGSFALRHSGGEELVAHVRGIARGRGRWQPFFRNWLIAEGDLADVVRRLRGDGAAATIEAAR